MRHARIGVRLVACFLVLSAVVLATGCLYGRDYSVNTTGAVVEPGRLALIEPGKTTREDLVYLIGPPSSTRKKDDGEILTYKAQRRESLDTGMFLLFKSSSKTTTITEYIFKIKDGIVQKYWRTES